MPVGEEPVLKTLNEGSVCILRKCSYNKDVCNYWIFFHFLNIGGTGRGNVSSSCPKSKHWRPNVESETQLFSVRSAFHGPNIWTKYSSSFYFPGTFTNISFSTGKYHSASWQMSYPTVQLSNVCVLLESNIDFKSELKGLRCACLLIFQFAPFKILVLPQINDSNAKYYHSGPIRSKSYI